MLRQLLLLGILLLLASFSKLVAQFCPIPNGNFEDWEDVSSLLDTTGVLVEETAFLPAGYFSMERIEKATFSQGYGNITDPLLATNYFGVEKSEDASKGEYSLKITGNNLHPSADAYTVFPCNGSLPDFLYLDLKHVGFGFDTLDILLTFGEDPVNPNNLFNLFRTTGFLLGEATGRGPTVWSTLALPIRINEPIISADSVVLWFVAKSNKASIDSGEESYFLVDNLRFDLTSTNTVELTETPVKVYPTIFSEELFIESEVGGLQAELINLTGKKAAAKSIYQGANSWQLAELGAGTYFLIFRNKDAEVVQQIQLIKR